ncbi:MAG: hypothetical protein JF616_08840 [Fibrobacteres bacterium]|nr:hypothetical protein [Fibrobacterota bacterium]
MNLKNLVPPLVAAALMGCILGGPGQSVRQSSADPDPSEPLTVAPTASIPYTVAGGWLVEKISADSAFTCYKGPVRMVRDTFSERFDSLRIDLADSLLTLTLPSHPTGLGGGYVQPDKVFRLARFGKGTGLEGRWRQLSMRLESLD